VKQHYNDPFRRQIKKLRIRAEVLTASVLPSVGTVLPDFLCIGAPRAATTWLHRMLLRHEDVFLPKVKELHFFDQPRYYVHTGADDMDWGRPFYFDMDSAAHWKWYYRKFAPGGNRIKGDITPAYSTLDSETIAIIHDRMPVARIIYIIRDPVDRAWSGCRRTLWSDAGVRPSEYKDLLSVVTHPEIIVRGKYRENIERWESLYPQDQCLYLFFDDIVENAQAQFDKVCDFIGIYRMQIPVQQKDGQKINMAPGESMPADVRNVLVDIYKGEKPYLERRFGRKLAGWVDQTGGVDEGDGQVNRA